MQNLLQEALPRTRLEVLKYAHFLNECFFALRPRAHFNSSKVHPANVHRPSQYILAPDSTVYIGCVGQDKYADFLRTKCDEAGVHTEYRVDETQPTGRCGVIITGHNRSMATHLAAANEYKLEHLKQPEIWSLVEKAQVYYVGGFHLTVCVPAMLALGEEAAAKNKTFIMNLSAPFIPQFFKSQLDEVMPYCDVLIGNEAEATAYAESHELGTKDFVEIAKHIAGLPKRSVKKGRTAIITQGTDPTIVAVNNQGKIEVTTYEVHPIEAEKINDTNGAG